MDLTSIAEKRAATATAVPGAVGRSSCEQGRALEFPNETRGHAIAGDVDAKRSTHWELRSRNHADRWANAGAHHHAASSKDKTLRKDCQGSRANEPAGSQSCPRARPRQGSWTTTLCYTRNRGHHLRIRRLLGAPPRTPKGPRSWSTTETILQEKDWVAARLLQQPIQGSLGGA